MHRAEPNPTATGPTATLLVGGQIVDPIEGVFADSIEPATGRPWGRIAMAGAEDVDRAVQAGARAQPAWAALEPADRRRALTALANAIGAAADDVAAVEARDVGNTIGKARADAVNAAAAIRYFVELSHQLDGAATHPAPKGSLRYTRLEPYGVVGRIVPFNHPFMFAAAKLAAPLLTGNTVVVKPPEQDALSMAVFAELCQAWLPPGVVNVVTGAGVDVGEALVRHPLVRRLAFTGSVATGLRVLETAATSGTVKHVTLELGGKNPMILLADAPVEAATAAAVDGMSFSWQGQSCGSTSRLLVHEDIYDEVCGRVAERVAGLRVGDPTDDRSEVGPVVSADQHRKVTELIGSGLAEGARLLTGGGRPEGTEFAEGFWIEPTVFADVTPEMRIAREEIFGPVLSIMRWTTLDEALAVANGLDYGLTASVWSADVGTALAVADRIESGYVWVNTVGAKPLGLPYGGFKNSGLGRESCIDELRSYTQTKSYVVDLVAR